MRGFDVDEEVDSDVESWLARVHPDDRNHIRETLAKQNAGDILLNVFEYRERHRDGHYIWISSKGAPDAWAPDGSPIRMIGTDTDITQRKLQEQHLRDLTHRLGLALRVSRIGVFESQSQNRRALLGRSRTRDFWLPAGARCRNEPPTGSKPSTPRTHTRILLSFA